MFDSLNLNPEIFGLDISDLSLKAVDVKEQKGKLNLAALGCASLSPGIVKKGEIKNVEKLAGAIKELVAKTQGISTRYVVASLPEEKSFVRIIQMPKMTVKEIKSAVRFEAENYIPFSIDKVYFDSQIIYPLTVSKNQTDVLIAAFPKKIVDSYVKAIHKAGLIPVSLETESQATIRALIPKQRTKDPVFLIDLGSAGTSFILCSGSFLCYSSFVPISSDRFTESIADSLGVELSEAEKLKRPTAFKGWAMRAKEFLKPCFLN